MLLNNLDSLIEAAVVDGQLSAGMSPKLVAAKSFMGSKGVAILSGKSRNAPKRAKSPAWSKEDDRFLESQLGVLSDEEIGDVLGRSPVAVGLRWKRDLKLPAPSKNPDIMTFNQVANGLCIDLHSVLNLHSRGLFPGYCLPGRDVTRVIPRITLLRWIVNPMNWVYFKPGRVGSRQTGHRVGQVFDHVFWTYARRLVLKKQKLWKDKWLRIGDVARYHGVHHGIINSAIHKGRLPAVDWGNWFLLKSIACKPGLSLQSYQGKGGKGHQVIKLSRDAEAFLVLSEAIGLLHIEIAALMNWNVKRVAWLLQRLHRNPGRIPLVIRQNRLKVVYNKKTGETFADWGMHRRRFPRLARLMESLPDRRLDRAESRYVNKVKRKALFYKKTRNTKRGGS